MFSSASASRKGMLIEGEQKEVNTHLNRIETICKPDSLNTPW